MIARGRASSRWGASWVGACALSLFACATFASAPALASITASVTVAPGQQTTIAPGNTTQLQITLSNNDTGGAATAVAFSNSLPGTLPNGLKVASAATYNCTDPSGPTTSAGAGTLTAAVGTQTISLTGGSIPARASGTDGSCTIIIPVTAGTTTGNAATYTYTIANGAVTSSGGANSGAVNQSINISQISKPIVSKSFATQNIYLGGASTTLTFQVYNGSTTAPLTNFSLTDNFPNYLGTPAIKVAATPSPSVSCTGASTPPTFTPVAGATSITASGGTIAPGKVCTISVKVEGNVDTDGNLVTNTFVGATDFTSDIGLLPSNAVASIRVKSPLTITKAFAHPSVAAGQTDTFSIVFGNLSTSPLTINSFTDSPIDGVGDLSYGLKLTAAPTMSCTSGTPGTFAVNGTNTGFSQTVNTTISPNSSCTLTGSFQGTVQNPNTPIAFTNTIPKGAVGTLTAGVVSPQASASVLVLDSLRVSKTMSPVGVIPGNPVRYNVTVENWSSSALTNTVISDVLTNGQTFLTGTIGANNYTPTLTGTGCSGISTPAVTGATSVPLTVGTIPARASISSPGSCTVTFWAATSASATNGSTFGNVLPAGSVCYNSGATCNGSGSNAVSGTISTSVVSVTKTFLGSSPAPDGAVRQVRVTLSNWSANPLTSVSVSDSLPTASGGGIMRIAPTPNASTTCGGSPTITATANSTSFTLNNATVPARTSGGTGAAGTCMVTVDVVATPGSYTNTATVAGTETYGNGTTHAVGPVSASASIVYLSSLTATKSFSPTSVVSGGTSTVRVRLTNAGTASMTSVAVTDPLPSGMVLANPVSATSTCAGSPVFSGAVGSSSITMTGASLAAGGTCDMLFDVTATGASQWVNTIPVGNITAAGGISNRTAVAGTLSNSGGSSVTISKATNPSTLAFPGQVSQLTITLTAGIVGVTDMSFTDYFTVDGLAGSTPNGMTVAANPAASTTCTGGTVTATPGAESVSMTGAILGNASCTVTLNVTSNTVGGITNYIPIGSVDTAQGLTNAGQATTSLTTQSNLGITKQFTPNVISSGARSRLRITFYNPSSQAVSGMSVTDTLPVGVTVPAGPNPTTTCTGGTVSSTSGTVTLSGANMPATSGPTAASCYAEIDVTSAAEGVYVNTIGASAITATTGGSPVTNTLPTSDTLRVKDPVTIHKAFDGLTLDTGNPGGFATGTATRAAGSPATMTVRLENPNATTLTQALLVDTLPSGLVVAPTPSASTSCASGFVTAPSSATEVRLTGATIPANGFCTVTVNVVSNVSGTYTNTIAASALSTLEGVTNEDPTSAALLVTTPPTVSKQFVPPVISAGGTSTLTIFLDNDNAGVATLTSALVDTLPTAPGNVLVAATPNVVKTCPDSVTAVAGAGTVTYASGGAIPPGGCTISVDVTASTSGAHTNTIAAGDLQTSFGNNTDPATATLTVGTSGFISGKVFNDNNVTPNGTFETGTDTVLPGVTLSLYSGGVCTGAALATQTTDSAGNYTFASLAAGTYSVCQASQPSGTANGITTAGTIVSSGGSTGTVGTASNPTATTSRIISIVLNGDGAGGAVSGSINNNFAEVVRSSISGTVFFDVNNNGIQNGGDAGIGSVTVELLNGAGAVISSQTTASDGTYSFTGLAAGTYSVREPTQPSNSSNGLTIAGTVANGGIAGTATAPTTTPSEISTILLPPNTEANDNNFAEIPNTREIRGYVFFDQANDGVWNTGDYGISGVVLTLSGTDTNGNAVTGAATTSAAGAYSFAGLPAGTYTIDQTAQPSGTVNGTTTAGTTGGTASNPTATSSRILNLDLTGVNILSSGNDFAEVPNAGVDLTIDKAHTQASFAEGSTTGVFTLTPHNIGTSASSGTITVADTLPAGMTVAATPTGTGWTCTGAVGATTVSCTSSAVIGAGGTGNVITLRVAVASGTTGQVITNTATIAGGSEASQFTGNNSDSDAVAITASATVSGKVWRDLDHDRIYDAGETLVSGWLVELMFGGNVVGSATTNSSGAYSITGISPGTGYTIRFVEPTTGRVFGSAVTNETGAAATSGVVSGGNPAGATFTDGTLAGLTLVAGDNIVQQSLPLDPSGVVYDAVTRLPVAGAVVTITGTNGFTAADLVGGVDTVTTGADGLYQFLLLPTAPNATYTLTITTYPSGYKPQQSTLIPVCNNTMDVGGPLGSVFAMQTSVNAPTTSATIHNPATCPVNTAALNGTNQASTQHYFTFTIDPSADGGVVNNHIPLDPLSAGDIVVTKTTPIINANIGQLVPYTITIRNTTTDPLTNITFRDVVPAGFKYKVGTATLDGVATEPSVSGRNLSWAGQTLAATTTRTIKLLLVVGSGVQPGEYVNSAQALSAVGVGLSNIATATVRVIPDPLFDCSEIIGKVFDDKNANGYQDEGEPGIPGVRMATVNGLLVTADDQGRFHIACAQVPDADHGSNFVMKLDERTLPTGYRVTTENPRDVRLTRGKMSKLNFGASIHKVVRIDLRGDAFDAGSTTLKSSWAHQLALLPEKLRDQPVVVRVGYVAAANEDAALARQRMGEISRTLKQLWEEKKCAFPLMIEEELSLPKGAASSKEGT